jgi:hypothetical protein
VVEAHPFTNCDSVNDKREGEERERDDVATWRDNFVHLVDFPATSYFHRSFINLS